MSQTAAGKSIKPILIASLAIASIACLGPLFGVRERSIVHFSKVLDLCWLLVFVVGLFKFRRRGLWLLAGLPLVLWWPYVFFMIVWTCRHNVRLAHE